MRKLDRRDIESVFNQLEALGWINRAPGLRPTDPPRWRVNPEVHRRFAQHAERESERRQRERAIIADLTRSGGRRCPGAGGSIHSLRDNGDTAP
jgi:hypothetical protein